VGAPPAQVVPDGVEVLGEVASVAEPLRSATLFVLPSLQEGFGLVVAEALAAGVPALVTPSGGPEDLVRESGGGEVLDGFAADELAVRAGALLGDGDRLREMRRRGRAYVVREHDPARLRDALREALDELDAG
jgi:glycosyltransferase involved in cell wall biosynthesis